VQTPWQSTCEVAIDFGCALLINIGSQLVFYRAVATTGRVTLLAVLILGSAIGRRFITRRAFETLVPAGTRQSRWQSGLESLTDTALGLAIAVALQMLIYGEVATLLRASGLTGLVYSLAMLRRYLLRRVFAAWALRTA